MINAVHTKKHYALTSLTTTHLPSNKLMMSIINHRSRTMDWGERKRNNAVAAAKRASNRAMTARIDRARRAGCYLESGCHAERAQISVDYLLTANIELGKQLTIWWIELIMSGFRDSRSNAAETDSLGGAVTAIARSLAILLEQRIG